MTEDDVLYEKYLDWEVEIWRYWAVFVAMGLRYGWYAAALHMHRVTATLVAVNTGALVIRRRR